MGTVKDKLNLLLNTKSSIRDAIAAMGQAVAATVPFSGYAAKIRAISSDATAAAADILSGKTAYTGGQKINGTIASKGAADLTASGPTVSVPAGYYPEDVSKSVAAAEQAVPGISVSSSGLITASAAQEAGYVAAGTKSATRQLTTQGAATITPGASAKTAVAAGRYTTGAVQVAGDANLVAGNIKSGVSIFGVAGNVVTSKTVNLTVVNNSPYGFQVWTCIPTGAQSVDVSAKSSKTVSVMVGSSVLFFKSNGVYNWAVSSPSHNPTFLICRDTSLGLNEGFATTVFDSAATITIS